MTTYSAGLITGANGFVGSHFVGRLASEFPHIAFWIGSRRGGGNPNLEAQIQSVALDITMPLELELPVDIVFHIAGEKRDEKCMWDVNLEGTRRLLDWAAQRNVKRFVYLSSVGVYGAVKNAGLVAEGAPKHPQNTYEASKSAAEDLVRESCSKSGMEYVIIQPSNVIGWSDGKAYPLLGLMKMIRRGWFTYFGDVETCFNYVAVEDVAAALIAATEQQAANRVFMLNSPAPMKSAVGWIADELGVSPPVRRLPATVGRLAAELADLLAGLTGRSVPFGRERFTELTNTTCYSGALINDVLNFSYPMGIEGAIRRLVRQYRKEGLL